MAIILTEAAAAHVRKYLGKRGQGEGLRVAVKSTGCSGLMYVVDHADAIESQDHVFESHGVKVIIDEKSLSYLDGTELDYSREALNEGFKFNNPNVKSACGCGESFSV
ncbi:MAG: iron-sulfur cluster assembly protein IscA [Acidiferrobacterales bacterium]